MANDQKDAVKKVENESGLSTTVVALMTFSNTLNVIQYLMGRGIMLRYKRLRKVIILIQEVEQYIFKEMPSGHFKKDSITLRTISGFITAIILVLHVSFFYLS